MARDRFRSFLLGAVVLPVLLLLALGAMFGAQILRLSHAAKLVDDTDVLLTSAEDVDVMLLEQRSAARAWVVTHAAHFRDEALAYSPETRIRQLEWMTIEARRQSLENAAVQARAWQDFLRARLAGAPETEPFMVESTAALAPVRNALASWVKEERRMRERRSEASRAQVAWTMRGGIAVLAAVGLLLGVFARGQLGALRTRYEQALEEERANQRMSEMFVGILGHDLLSPLSAIVVGSHGLLRSASGPSAQMLHHVLHAAERMQRMIDQLLDLTRARLSGGIVVDRKIVSVGDLCRAIVDEARSAHPDRVIELAIDDDPKASLDHDRFGQVVANLVANGLAHGSATAPLSIAVRRVDGDVEVSVHNEGPEIPADLVPHLFEPFRRAEGKPRARGLGLGLYIAERIVVAHGGRIDVESSATHGTTFRVRVPTVQS